MSCSNFVYSSWNFFPGAIQLAECEALQLNTSLCVQTVSSSFCYSSLLFWFFSVLSCPPFQCFWHQIPTLPTKELAKEAHLSICWALWAKKKRCQSFPAGSHYLLIILAFIMKQRGIKKPAKRAEEQYRYVLWPARNWATKMDQTETNVIKVDSII